MDDYLRLGVRFISGWRTANREVTADVLVATTLAVLVARWHDGWHCYATTSTQSARTTLDNSAAKSGYGELTSRGDATFFGSLAINTQPSIWSKYIEAKYMPRVQSRILVLPAIHASGLGRPQKRFYAGSQILGNIDNSHAGSDDQNIPISRSSSSIWLNIDKCSGISYATVVAWYGALWLHESVASGDG